MRKDETTSAQWDAMTDQQKIEWLAVKVMGYEYKSEMSPFGGKLSFWYDPAVRKRIGVWNPLTDWNHTFEIIKKMQSLGFHYEISNGVHSEPSYCRFWSKEMLRDETVYGEQQEAICKATFLSTKATLFL